MEKINDFSKMILVLLTSKLQVLLQKEGYGIVSGLIIWFSDIKVKEAYLSFVRKLNTMPKELHGKRIPKASNSDIVCISYRNSMTCEGIYKYMTEPEYLPTLVISGLFPEALKEYENILALDSICVSSSMAEKLVQELDECVEFMADNVSEVCNSIREASMLVKEDDEISFSSLAMALYATGSVYRRYLLATGKESFSCDELLKVVNELVINDLTDDIEVSAPVRKSLYNYIDNFGITVGPIDCYEPLLWKAVKEKMAILFDDENYYVPESLLNNATADLQGAVSFRTIKEALCRKGILVTDRVTGNYTIKKQVAIGTPYASRERFLVLKQACFDSPEASTIRERSEF